jgi:hypothetical protein
MGWYGGDERAVRSNKIREKLNTLHLPMNTSNNSIYPLDIIESFFVSVWTGCFKFSQTAIVRMDETLRQIFGWKRVASGTTLGRFFKSLIMRKTVVCLLN